MGFLPATYGEMPYTRRMTSTKNRRIDLRLTEPQKELIEEAAALTGRTVTDFSTDALTREAHEVIRRERMLRVDAEAFDAFAAELDRPAQTIDGLASLLKRPSVFVD